MGLLAPDFCNSLLLFGYLTTVTICKCNYTVYAQIHWSYWPTLRYPLHVGGVLFGADVTYMRLTHGMLVLFVYPQHLKISLIQPLTTSPDHILLEYTLQLSKIR